MMRNRISLLYPAVYLVAAFLALSLAFSAFPSESLLRTNPSPLHSEQIPEPLQSSQVFKGTWVYNEFEIKYKCWLQVFA